MEILGVSLEDFFLYGLIISGILTFLLIFLNDVFAGLELPDFLNPTLILSFLTIGSACGYILTKLSGLTTMLIFVISAVIAFVLVALLNIFVLVPVSMAQESLTITEDDLRGRIGMVITGIPENGYGEVLIISKSGSIAKPAISFDQVSIAAQTKVLIIDVHNGVLHVSPHEEIVEFG